MSTISGSFTAKGVSSPIRVEFGGSVSIAVSNTFVATVKVQESTDLQAWKDIDSFTTTFTRNYRNSGPLQEAKYYRDYVSAFTSGDVDYSLSGFSSTLNSPPKFKVLARGITTTQ